MPFDEHYTGESARPLRDNTQEGGVDPSRPADVELTPTELLASLVQKLTEAQAANALTPAQLEQILTRANLTSAEAMRVSLKPENADHRHRSVYFTDADAAKYGEFTEKPVLKRRTFFVGSLENEDRLTPGEIEAYNDLGDLVSARGGKVTARHGTWSATVQQHGHQQELFITVPCDTIDQRMDMAPSLLLTLLELQGRLATDDIAQKIRQLEFLKAKMLHQGMDAKVLEQELLQQ